MSVAQLKNIIEKIESRGGYFGLKKVGGVVHDGFNQGIDANERTFPTLYQIRQGRTTYTNDGGLINNAVTEDRGIVRIGKGATTGGITTGGVLTGGVLTGGVLTGGVLTGGAQITGGVLTGGRRKKVSKAKVGSNKRGGAIENFAGVQGGAIENFAGVQGGSIENFAGVKGGSMRNFAGVKGGRNSWLDHVKAYREAHPDVSYAQALKDAKTSYQRVPSVKVENSAPKRPSRAKSEARSMASKQRANTNPWLLHVKSVKDANPGMKYKDVLINAKRSYNKMGGSEIDVGKFITGGK